MSDDVLRKKQEREKKEQDDKAKEQKDLLKIALTTAQWRYFEAFAASVSLAVPKGGEKATGSSKTEGSTDTTPSDSSPSSSPGTGGSGRSVSSINKPIPGFYVIVGNGAAAIVNHTTLRQTSWGRDRIGSLPVLHIGMPDPWLHYFEHGMGQPPYLLRLPGYHSPAPLDAKTIHTGLSSKVFARSTNEEWRLLYDTYNDWLQIGDHAIRRVAQMEGWVAAVESREKKTSAKVKEALKKFGVPEADVRFAEEHSLFAPPYRLLVVCLLGGDPKSLWVYAHKIDFCSGAGRSRVDYKPKAARADRDDALMADAEAAPLIEKAISKPWVSSLLWTEEKTRKIITAMDGLTEHTTWTSGERILVYGNGGIGLNQIERARDKDGNGSTFYMDWYPRGPLAPATFNLRRNDNVLRSAAWVPAEISLEPTEAELEGFGEVGGADIVRLNRNGELAYDEKIPLFPGSARWRSGIECHLDCISGGGPFSVTYYKKDKALVRDFYHVKAKLRDELGRPVYDEAETEASCSKVNPAGFIPFSVKYATANYDLTPAGYAGGMYFDRIILANGLNPNVPGEPAQAVAEFRFYATIVKDRMVGLETANGDIRLMGAAHVMYPGVAQKEKSEEMEDFHKTLPVSAVPPGFIRSGVNIATANHYFDIIDNCNVNTASKAELEKQLIQGGLSADNATKVAMAIMKGRAFPNNGHPSMEKLVETLALDATLSTVPNWRGALRELKIDYPPARPLLK